MSLRTPDDANATHPWYQPFGLRVWNIWATKNGDTIVEFNGECLTNHIKLYKFNRLLAAKGFALNNDQLKNIKKKLSIDFVVADKSEHDLRKMCEYCGAETDIGKVCAYTRVQLLAFGESLGLEFCDLEDVLVKHGNGAYTRSV
jgi:hypothetical protein